MFRGYFSLIRQVAAGDCAYLTMAAMHAPLTLSYRRVNGRPRDKTQWAELKKLAAQWRSWSADAVIKYADTDAQTKLMVDQSLTDYSVKTVQELADRIRKV